MARSEKLIIELSNSIYLFDCSLFMYEKDCFEAIWSMASGELRFMKTRKALGRLVTHDSDVRYIHGLVYKTVGTSL